MRHPKEIGDWTTLMVVTALKQQGLDIYLPFGENTRCDLVTDNGSKLSRVQCKTGRLRDGAVQFAPCSSYGHHANYKAVRRSYVGEIDEFGVFCPETGGVYLIPIEDVCATARARFRVEPVRNGQVRRVNYAKPYEIATIDVL